MRLISNRLFTACAVLSLATGLLAQGKSDLSHGQPTAPDQANASTTADATGTDTVSAPTDVEEITPDAGSVAAAVAAGQTAVAPGHSGDPHGPPAGDAHPPIHFRPDLSSSPVGYSVAKVRHAYGFDKISGSGAGQVVAIVDAYGSSTLANDLAVFSSKFGLPGATLRIYYPQGKPSASNAGWAMETSLDVEWAHAIAPNAVIALIVTKSASLSDLLSGVDYAVSLGVKQVSMSWGAAEFSSQANYDSHFNRAGVSFFASSGDNGAGVDWPAVSSYVIGVGGTSLHLDSSGNVTSESAWSGSGGGTSAYTARPSFQNSWNPSIRRGVPDVSYNADPNTGFAVYIGNYNGQAGWTAVGGTSAGAPQWAALAAVVNATRSTAMSTTDVRVYAAASANYSGNYRDITSGNNGSFSAGPKYDFATGLGSPLSATLVPYLATH